MTTGSEWKTTKRDLEILRTLAKRIAEISALEENQERRQAWYAHDAGEPVRPMVLIEPFGVDEKEFPEDYRRVECGEEWARELEGDLRRQIWQFENVRDDQVIEPHINCPWRVEVSNYGVEEHYDYGDNPEGMRGSYKWDAPIKDLDRDFDQLHPRTYTVDRDATLAWKALMEEVFDGILQARIRGKFWWTMGMTWEAIKLVGLENLMLLMYDNPKGLHRLMGFLRDDHMAFARWLETEGLLTLNNENDYIGSGSIAYTRALPHPDKPAEGPARMKDLWLLLESQETVGVGPELFGEFIYPYQASIAEHFGRVYYGCCEPVHSRWHIVKHLTNLRRVSVSPWCDQEFMAAHMEAGQAFCRKPNPAQISTDNFDEDHIRCDLRTTLDAAGGMPLEIAMKDVHTVRSHPERFGRWVELAREEIAGRR